MSAGADVGSESSEKKCKICNKVLDRRALKCAIKCKSSKCNVAVHVDCFEIVENVFLVQKVNWRCRSCSECLNIGASCSGSTDSDTLVIQKENDCLIREKELLNKLLTELDYTVTLQKAKIEELSVKTVNNPFLSTVTAKQPMPSFYSDAIKSKNATSGVPMSSVLLIKTSNKAISNVEVEKDIKSQVSPGSLNVKIHSTKLIKDGLLVNCENQDSLNILKNTLENKVGSKYNISEQRKINPRIIVYSVHKDCFENENFIQNVISDNNLNASVGDIKVITKTSYKNVFNIIFEVKSLLYHQIMEKGYLYMGWNRCRVQEHFSLPRCFKCCKYGHHKKDCRSESVVCPNCSGSHEKNVCTSAAKTCINCKFFNNKFGKNVPTDHAVSNPICDYFKFKLEHLKYKINYEQNATQ